MPSRVELVEDALKLGIKGCRAMKKAVLEEQIKNHPDSKALLAQVAEKDEPDEVEQEALKQVTVREEAKKELSENQKALVEADEAHKTPKEKKLTTWQKFLKAYRDEHSCSMKEAMKHGAEYAEFKKSLEA